MKEGRTPAGWYTSGGGLFSDLPHLVLHEHVWDATAATARGRFFVLDDDGAVEEYGEELTAYTDEDYRRLLLDAGFVDIEIAPGPGACRDADMIVVTARRAADGSDRDEIGGPG